MKTRQKILYVQQIGRFALKPTTKVFRGSSESKENIIEEYIEKRKEEDEFYDIEQVTCRSSFEFWRTKF